MLLFDIFESTAERMVRSENKGDAMTQSRIRHIRDLQKAGLISDREAEQQLNRMTKSWRERHKK